MKKSGKIMGGIGIAALAAAGAYFLGGKRGARNREAIKGWSLKMKGDILDKVESMKKIDRDTYLRLVDKVADRYAKMETISGDELRHITVELKNAWNQVEKKKK